MNELFSEFALIPSSLPSRIQNKLDKQLFDNWYDEQLRQVKDTPIKYLE